LTAEVFEVLSTINNFSQLTPDKVSIEKLGGLTNRNYRISCDHGTYVLRIAGEGTGDYIDRGTEFHNATIASNAGVNAEIVHFDVASGTMICRYIDNAVTLDINELRDLEVVKRTGRAFRELHSCGTDFKGRFELFEQIDQYLKVLQDLKAELPDGYQEVQKDAEEVRAALSLHTLPAAPCHCDPMVENCIDNGQRVYIIDFEYAGNNDPMWDLGDLSVEGDFTVEQDRALMSAYFGHQPAAFDVGRMVMYKAMCDLLWTLWGVVQHANNNPADDFWSYATGRLERCRKLMANDDFSHQLATVKQGP